MENIVNSEFADFTHHALWGAGLLLVAGALIAFWAARRERIPRLVRWMRLVERLVLGLWVGFIAANVAILASALPYIYTTQDVPMRCGSLGIANFAINMITGAMLAIILLALLLYGGRVCISATIRARGPLVGFIVREGAIIGSFLWVASAFSGLTVFAWFLESFTILVPNPPQIPPNLSDKACSEFIGTASKPPNFEPFGVWFRILR
jgi:hypothetical protein